MISPITIGSSAVQELTLCGGSASSLAVAEKKFTALLLGAPALVLVSV